MGTNPMMIPSAQMAGSIINVTGAYRALIRSRRWSPARRAAASKTRFDVTNRARLNRLDSPRGTTTVTMADESTHSTNAHPSANSSTSTTTIH